MSDPPRNVTNQNNRSGRGRGGGRQTNPAQASATNIRQTQEPMPLFSPEQFPSLLEGASRPTVAATTTRMSSSNSNQATASSTHGPQFSTLSYAYFPTNPQGNTHHLQPLMPSTQSSSQTDVDRRPSFRQNYPVTVSQPTTTVSSHSQQTTAMKPAIPTNNNSSTESERPLSAYEKDINNKLIEIILTIHHSKEYVSREKVQRALFNHFKVNSWHELRVNPGRFTALINLSDGQKDITFYMQVFEQVFNLCTLNDLQSILAKSMKVNEYEDLQLGPLEKNPEVQRVFKYKPRNPNQPIPTITTGDVIKQFMDFQKEHRHQRNMPFEEFLDKLVKIYELQSREELGIFCKSFPFLVQMTGQVRRDSDYHIHQARQESQQELIAAVRKRLDELKEEMRDAEEFSSFNNKKTTTAVFNHLTSIVDKYLDIVPQQADLYAILVQLRENELLRCLLNISIYLGTISKPEEFIAELKQIYEQQGKNGQIQGPLITQQLTDTNTKLSRKDKRKINAMLQQQQQQQQQQQPQASNGDLDEQNATTSTPVHTSFASSLLTSHPERPKPPVARKDLCSDIYTRLVRYDTVLTIDQLLEVDEELCAKHGVPNFAAFNYDQNENTSNNPVNLLSFLDKHRKTIDPHDELSVYENTASIGDQTELFSFIQQLSPINNTDINEDNQQQSVAVVHGHVHTEHVNMSGEKLSAIEKAIKHKFGRHIRKGNQLIKKAKQRHRKNNFSVIRYEESLLDVNGLNRLGICPTSLNVDETRLYHLILHSPLMTDLYTWLQWHCFFEPKYGTLKSFIVKHEKKFRDLRLLETSTHELVRLPIDATLTTFENELNLMRIRSAVGHLCTSIIQEGLVTRFPLNVYRTSMVTWLRQLRSLIALQNDHINPLQCIVDFLMYLPVLIGQSRIVEELVLQPLEDVFGNDREDGINVRTRIWNLADAKQKDKLELWGYLVNVTEWKNQNKWSGHEESEVEKSVVQKPTNQSIEKSNIDTTVDSIMSTTTTVESDPTLLSNTTPVTPTPTTTTTTYIDGDNDSIEAAFQHIESIRHGFGVDSTLDSTGQSIVSNLQGMVERSLAKLSTDLYSDQGHFVLELIQNADDNQYTNDRWPTLRFILSSEQILVCNNEIGFRPENIGAICNVGASTKGKHKEGYAGHKGIGFKSVFMISHRPEIHSRNYHIRFDTMNGKDQIGYIRPIWLDQYEEQIPNPQEWTTCIRLPIKAETRYDRLQRNFDEIQPILLLFLNHLRQIEIINQSDASSNNHTSRIFTRIDHAKGHIIELQEKLLGKPIITNFWLVIKRVIKVPDHIQIKLRDIKGEVESTTIAIAYPLSGIGESSNQLPPPQPLFAYLPLRTYGFRFILQADFEIPATREEIYRDNLWNEWLKSEMTCLLYLAYGEFQTLPDLLASSSINTQINTHLTPIQTIKYFLKLIPSRNELDPYFNTFVDKSIQLLMGIIKLPVSRQNDKQETIIDWVLPSQCVIINDSFIRKILSQDLLLSHFNCYYLHEEIAAECDEQILVSLGCRQLDFTDIVKLIEVSYKQDDQQHPKTTAAIEQIAQWLVCLDYSLQQQREQMCFDRHHTEKEEKETLSKLKEMKIIPLKDKPYLVSVSECEKPGISFPLDKSARYSKYFKIVLDDTPILDEQLINYIDDKYPRRIDSIKRLLRKLGINETLNFREIYREHILPIMSDPNRWSAKSEAVLISYLLSIYEYLYAPDPEKFENDLRELRKKMVVKTRDNKFVSLGSSDVIVHLTTRYGTNISLESLRLTKSKFTFIADDYCIQCPPDIAFPRHSHSNLAEFLKDLNINDFLQIESTEKSFIKVPELADTQWAYLIPSLSEMIHDIFIIRDYRCEEFIKLVSSSNENPTVDIELCVQLLQYLDKHHEAVSPYYAASIFLARKHKFGDTPIKAITSSFCTSLREHAWIPVAGGVLYKPSDVYYLSQDNETSVFRRYVPHLDTSKLFLYNQDFIYHILGIKSQVTPQTMFELLMKWSCDLDPEPLWNLIKQTDTSEIMPCTLPNTYSKTCVDTIANFRQIYRYLVSKDDTRFLLSQFRLWPIIFIPQDQTTGHFLYANQVFWDDPISILSSPPDATTDSKVRISIQAYYDNDPILQKFFFEILQIEPRPTIDDYLPLLSAIQDTDTIWKIIQAFLQLAIEQNKQQELRDKCLNIRFIPCMGSQKQLVKYTDHPFYSHNNDIAKLFVDTLPIIKLPNFNLPSDFKEAFCQLFDIEYLDKVIQTKTDVNNEQPSTSLTEFYRSSIDLIQDFLLNKKLIFDTKLTRLSTIFSRMQFMCVDSIHLSYCYGSDIVKTTPNSSNVDTYIDEQTCKFYILKKFENSEMRYTDAMAKFIVDEKQSQTELLEYIKTLLQTYQNEGVEGLAKLRNNLTQNYEPKWIIPDIKKDIPETVTLSEEQEEETNSTTVEITQEMIDEIAGKVSRRQKRPPKPKTDENTENGLIAFPEKAGAVESDTLKPKDPSKTQIKSKADDVVETESIPNTNDSTQTTPMSKVNESTGTSSISKIKDSAEAASVVDTKSTIKTEHISKENDQNQRVSQNHQDTENEHVASKNRPSTHSHGDKIRREPDENDAQSHKHRFVPSNIPREFLDSKDLPPPTFEHITISTLTNFDLPSEVPLNNDSSNTHPFHSTNNELDRITGLQGEKLVFDYLKWRYPNETVTWLNEKEELYGPYDIHIIFKSENDREEFIEVKTTRSLDQNTFPLSINELEYLLRHPTNYFIYRVYYATPRELSTMTILNKIKQNLKAEHFKLSMTVLSKLSD